MIGVHYLHISDSTDTDANKNHIKCQVLPQIFIFTDVTLNVALCFLHYIVYNTQQQQPVEKKKVD